ncbi:MAG: hypothetical protein E6767_19695 [Dysgonomonas sp.]|nr:hypothetical protein [Dysgonomonas sp.]
MKQLTILLLSLLLLCLSHQMSAQVTIGMDSKPVEGAILQLKETESSTDNSTKGLLMPRVKLSSLTITSGSDLKTTITGATGTATWDKDEHTGLLVFHVGDATHPVADLKAPNLYVWTGKEWLLVKAT